MTSRALRCPSEDEVACFIEGKLDADAAECIRHHVEVCAECRMLVASALRPMSVDASRSRPGEPRTFVVGTVLNRRFRIDRFVARGGMGEVYEVWDLELQEKVALKTLVCTGLDNVRLFPRIRAEVQLARRITHPNVCRILEFGIAASAEHESAERIPFFTMEYLQGSTLKQYVRENRRLSQATILLLATQIAEGLSAVHAAGIVHRDLKPENVFVVPQGNDALRAVVMDFGLARATIEQEGHTGLSSDAPVGTPAYMAPEQTIGGQPTPAWDVYALGVIVFELLSGKLPFSGTNAFAMAMARVRDPAPALPSSCEVHPALAALVARCLETDPRRRFRRVEAVRSALARISLEDSARARGRDWKGRLAIGLLCGPLVVAAASVQRFQSRGSSEPVTPAGSVGRGAVELEPAPSHAQPESLGEIGVEISRQALGSYSHSESTRLQDRASLPVREPSEVRRVLASPRRVLRQNDGLTRIPQNGSVLDSGARTESGRDSRDPDEVVIPAFARTMRQQNEQ